MPDLTLPGTMDGLLLRTSPVHVTTPAECGIAPFDSVVAEVLDNAARLWVPAEAWDLDEVNDEHDVYHLDWITLDLRDPTGRVHAAWWAARQPEAAWNRALTMDDYGILCSLLQGIRHGHFETDHNIEHLQALCLKMAGIP